MTDFVITAVLEVEPGRVPLGKDVAARWWGPGHRLSCCDGRTLTLVVEVTASDADHAFEAVASRAESVWEALTGRPMPAPTTMRLREVPPAEPQVVGSAGCGPDGLFAEAAAGRAANLRATVAALAALAALPDVDDLEGRAQGAAGWG